MVHTIWDEKIRGPGRTLSNKESNFNIEKSKYKAKNDIDPWWTAKPARSKPNCNIFWKAIYKILTPTVIDNVGERTSSILFSTHEQYLCIICYLSLLNEHIFKLHLESWKLISVLTSKVLFIFYERISEV